MGKIIKAVMIMLVLGIVGYVAYDQLSKWHTQGLEVAVEQERKQWEGKTEQLEEKITGLTQELAQQQEALVPKDTLAEMFGEEAAVAPGTKEMSCEELKRSLTSFFSYLDQRDYIKSYGLEESTQQLFQKMVAQLTGTLPVVTDETRDVTTLLHNTAHFYRALGRKQLGVVKGILENESVVMESMMAVFYGWCTSGERCGDMVGKQPSLKVLYEYAGFFLNTLAGKGYLFRRDSKLRCLTTYYCVLILDKANDNTLNQHGLDIRPFITYALYDLDNQRGLINQKQYIAELERLKTKYQL